MKHGKQLLCTLLCLVLFLSLMPVALAEDVGTIQLVEETEEPADEPSISLVGDEEPQSVVASGSCGTNVQWSLDSNGTLSITGSGRMNDYPVSITTPWYDKGDVKTVVIGPGVTNVGVNAFFMNSETLETVSLPAGLTEIGDQAFMYCSKLTSINLPSSLTAIGEYAFMGCSGLSGSISIPGTVTSVSNHAFNGCSGITGVTLGDGVRSIGDNAFLGVKMSSISFPGTLSSIGKGAFAFCTDLTMMEFNGSAPSFGDTCFHQVTATAYYPASASGWTSSVMQNYGGTITWVNGSGGGSGDPEHQCGDKVYWSLDSNYTLTIYGEGEMWDYTTDTTPWRGESGNWIYQKIKKVVIEEGVTYIGNASFCGCRSLNTVSLPSTLTGIGQNVFSSCSSIVQITLPDGLTSIGLNAFSYCSALTAIVIPSGVKIIPEEMFMSCRALKSVSLPEGLTKIGKSAFYACKSLPEITLPKSLKTIDILAFASCDVLETIRFQGNAPSIGGNCFYNVTATAYYPAAASGWTSSVMQNYGGSITWVSEGIPFVDVPEGKYYYDPVVWAYFHTPQITGGIDATHFCPNKTCTREQIVTFLWKACGAPEPMTTENPFTDVNPAKYYYKAVMWAVEKGITGGVGDGKFGVGQPCTREQAMTFLWKACESPEPESNNNPFVDVPEGKWYYKPILWAVENGITGGVDATHFGVGQPCTRGQIVTFLYKALAPW